MLGFAPYRQSSVMRGEYFASKTGKETGHETSKEETSSILSFAHKAAPWLWESIQEGGGLPSYFHGGHRKETDTN